MSFVVLCEWHAATVDRLMTEVPEGEHVRDDVSAALARHCEDCEVTE